ncbi:MAG TPA: hypothetical protein VGQ96_00795 [Candidatus Eremiobacteraceae bacterium]|nr:hypothetical protein [Candidatus Eremiobacteraceae bacterium]
MNKRLAGSKRELYEPQIPLKRLRELRDTLRSESELSKDIREELAQALGYLGLTLALEKRAHKRGRKVNTNIAFAAYVVDQLMRNHGAKRIKAAVIAVLPETAYAKYEGRVKKAYRTLKAKDGFRQFWVSQERIDEAAARLRAQKSGNK